MRRFPALTAFDRTAKSGPSCRHEPGSGGRRNQAVPYAADHCSAEAEAGRGQAPERVEHGQIAQSVEQGIENPRVGGSIPPLATTLILLLSGCGDDCAEACQQTTNAIAVCMADDDAGWYADWADLGAENRREHREACQNSWNRTAATLEARELEQALEMCANAVDDLDTMDCDTLRALYQP